MSKPKFLKSSTLEMVFGPAKHVDDLPNSDKDAQHGKEVSEFFTEAVKALRDFEFMPNLAINKLMDVFFNLCKNDIIYTAMVNVKTLHFWCERKSKEEINGIVLVPFDYIEQFQKDKFFILGGMVFVASQAQDFWNIIEAFQQSRSNDIIERSWAYEAEYLLMLKYNMPDYQMNEYQLKVLEKYPDGLRSLPKELKYEPKEWSD